MNLGNVNAMPDFKLLAIRPLKGCDSLYKKNLSEGTIYKFYHDYTFLFENESDKHSKVVSIEYLPSIPENLYDINRNTDNLKINISAVVGKNGAGKSTLFELFYLAVYCVSTSEEILTPNETYLIDLISKSADGSEEGKLNSDSSSAKNLGHQALSNLRDIYNKFKTEVYYLSNNQIYCLRVDIAKERKCKLLKYLKVEKNSPFELHEENTSDFDFSSFFYSIAINYSIYGLNSKIIGDWVSDLFHKNDGYQTPLVINPYRDEGNIDINVEFHLANTRLICNLIDNSFTVKEVLKDKIVEGLVFRTSVKKHDTLLQVYNLPEAINRLTQKESKNKDEVLNHIYFKILNVAINDEQQQTLVQHPGIVNYVIGKVIKIVHQYIEYDKFKDFDEIRVGGQIASPFPSIKNFDGCLEKLARDKSHVTLKLRQILNTIRYDILRSSGDNIWIDNRLSLPIEELSKRIAPLVNDDTELMELIPAAFFIPEIQVRKKMDLLSEGHSKLETMSSGELQFVHSLQSVFYHILFISSVHNSGSNNLKKYSQINLLMDEIELYFHPDFQRMYISELLNGLNHLKISNIGTINILFSTHSPFILSDIPAANVLKLQEGSIYSQKGQQSFGANIHDLLDDSFFLNDGFMGEWARTKIISVIDFLENIINEHQELNNNNWDQKSIREFISVIGEPLLRESLKDLFSQAFQDTQG